MNHIGTKLRWLCVLIVLVLCSDQAVTAQDMPTEKNQNKPEEQQGEKLEAVVKGVWVNVLEGKIELERDGTTAEVTAGFEVHDGDVVESAPDARAEFLLQPGNYLRMSGETRIRFVNTQYDRLRIDLEKGSIACELLKTYESRYFEPFALFLIRVITPQSETLLSDSGIYRFNVLKDVSELIVRKGEAVMNGEKVKEKRIARSVNGVVNVTEFDTKTEQTFDGWCRERGNQLVQINRQLKNETPWAKHRKHTEAVLDIPQDDERSSTNGSPYVVSAKPGAVVFADLGAEVLRGDTWDPVNTDTDLRSHDKLRTAGYSRVELMLFPDILFRIDGDSEIAFEELSNDAIVIRIVRGTAILEAAEFDRKRLPEFKIGGADIFAVVDGGGNYRWDVTSNAAQFAARHGKLRISEHTIDGCRRYQAGTQSSCAKRQNDNFDYWSEFRGEGVTGNGRSLSNRYTRVRQRWLRDTGFWYHASSAGYYTFVPYSSTDFHSPYGGSYPVALSPRRSPIMNRPENRQVSQPSLERPERP
ncbi:MAG: hypothetical protein C5B55_02430 [Blastocatellia bacterium]|nr:MAG: hypothetical protein C5B55_02430 [Blastocatellia bacterium]